MSVPINCLPFFPRPARLVAALCCLATAAFSISCSSVRRIVKAKPAKQTAFLRGQSDLSQDPPETGAFQLMQRTTSPVVLRSAQSKPAISVLPVDLRWLKPPARNHAKRTGAQYAQMPIVQEIAGLLRQRFQEEANRVAKPRGNNALVLHLALTEFTPTSAAGNVAKTAAGFVIGPVAALASPLTKGTIAIEGQVIDPATGRTVFQFADRESDPMTFLSLRSYKSTAFAKVIIDQWAVQFPQALRTQPGIKQKDAPMLRLNPF